MRIDSQPTLAQRDEAGDGQQAVGCEVVKLRAVLAEQSAQERMDGEGDPSPEEISVYYPFAGSGLGNLLIILAPPVGRQQTLQSQGIEMGE